MQNVPTSVDEMTPRLVRMKSGAWLAVSESGSSLTLGIEGNTPDLALAGFREAVHKWRHLLDEPEAKRQFVGLDGVDIR